MAERCYVCDHQRRFAWTDTHGVAQCVTCGTPFRLFHYEDDRRVDKPPTPILDGDATPKLRRFFQETGSRLSAVGLGLSFPGGYDVAKREDIEAINAWFRAAEADKEAGDGND